MSTQNNSPRPARSRRRSWWDGQACVCCRRAACQALSCTSLCAFVSVAPMRRLLPLWFGCARRSEAGRSRCCEKKRISMPHQQVALAVRHHFDPPPPKYEINRCCTRSTSGSAIDTSHCCSRFSCCRHKRHQCVAVFTSRRLMSSTSLNSKA